MIFYFILKLIVLPHFLSLHTCNDWITSGSLPNLTSPNFPTSNDDKDWHKTAKLWSTNSLTLFSLILVESSTATIILYSRFDGLVLRSHILSFLQKKIIFNKNYIFSSDFFINNLKKLPVIGSNKWNDFSHVDSFSTFEITFESGCFGSFQN